MSVTVTIIHAPRVQYRIEKRWNDVHSKWTYRPQFAFETDGGIQWSDLYGLFDDERDARREIKRDKVNAAMRDKVEYIPVD